MNTLLIEANGKMRQVGRLCSIGRSTPVPVQIDVTSLDSPKGACVEDAGTLYFETSPGLGLWRRRGQNVRLTANMRDMTLSLGGRITKLKRSNKTKRTSIAILVTAAISVIER